MNETRRDYSYVDQTVTEPDLQTVMVDQEIEQENEDGMMVDVTIQVPQVQQIMVEKTIQVLVETDIPLTDEEQAALETERAAVNVSMLKVKASAALDKSDLTAIRCLKAGVAFPVEWQTYVADLRAIVAGRSQETALPAAPAFPAGT